MKTFEALLQTFAEWRAASAVEAPGYAPDRLDTLLRELGTYGDAQIAFDASWYAAAQELPQGRTGPKAALAHYLKTGLAAEADPTAWFSEAGYRQLYPDVREGIAAGAWRCGYQHYLLAGVWEHRSTGGEFNELAYLGQNRDVLDAVRGGTVPNGLLHYLNVGRTEGRSARPVPPAPLLNLPLVDSPMAIDASPVFAEQLYFSVNPDARVERDPSPGMRHWLSNGMFEDVSGLRPRPAHWVENLYLRYNPDLVPHIGTRGQPTGYSHYLMYGQAEGRRWAGGDWAKAESLILADAMRRRGTAPEGTGHPVISVIVPVYNTDRAALRACIDSVRTQTYPHWQLCLADDASTAPHVIEALEAAAQGDARVCPVYAPANGGIAVASNLALGVATGEFVALLDHDDVLAPDALLELARAFRSAPDVDLVYTDEAKITEDGTLTGFSAKPGWSPGLLLSTMYIGHLTAYRRSLVDQVGGFRPAFDGTQDYDLALRMAEVVRSVVHVPRPLYFWRMSPASTAGSIGAKSGVLDVQARALEATLVRRGWAGVVRPGHLPGHWAVVLDPPDPVPLVSVVIPSAGRSALIGGTEVDLLVNCLHSLQQSESYPNLEYVVVHNDDLRPATLLQLAAMPQVRLVRYTARPFNLSDKINLGVREAAGKFVLLLNDDMQSESTDNVQSLLGRMFDGVGIVGGRLLFAKGTLQHAGIVWMADGPTHAMIGEHRLTAGPSERLRDTHDVFGVSGACMFFRREVFLDCGGFSPQLPINYNDVDLCLKVRAKGLRVLFDPDVTLFHFESLSKSGTHFWELQRLLLSHPGIDDPYWNANFSRKSPFYELAEPGADERPSYRAWLIERIAARQAGLTPARTVRFSFIMSVYQNLRSQMEALEATVLNQTYAEWEWVIVDDGSSKAETLAWLEHIQAHPQVRFVRLPTNQGIMAGYGAAFRAATGDYVVPIDADDFLTLDCLHVLATAIERMGGPEVVYSDEDKGTERGDVHSPFLKPDWDPVLLSNICYICHVCAIKRDAAAAAGCYEDLASAWCHDWDTLLRMKRAGARIEHVPEVLYHWRIHQGSTASVETGTKPYTIDSQRHVLLEDLRLTGAGRAFALAENELFPHNGVWRLQPRPESVPPSAVLVVAGGEPGQTARFLGDLASMKRPADCATILVGEASARGVLDLVLPEVAAALWPEGAPAAPVGFTEALARCTAEQRLVAAVDPAVTGLNRDWLFEGLGMFAAADDVAAVGGQVNTDDGTVLWRGGYAGFGGAVGSPEFGRRHTDSGYHGTGWCQRSCDGVPAVCFFAGAEILQAAVGGSGGAVPATAAALRTIAGRLALLVRERGERVVYTPFVRVTLARPLAVSPIPPEGFAAVVRGGPAYYPAAFGQTFETAYALLEGPPAQVQPDQASAPKIAAVTARAA